ncbi:MAG: TIGR01212 family radical SAM protein [Acutalibacteraceae bacterium]|nr:TIGR01212 family radical SAM protein [Acutalibacteraceae bacterium]
MKYKTVNEHYKEKFGCKVYKLSLDGGFTCPNRDGTLSDKGCIFCSDKGSGEFAEKNRCDISEQLERAKLRVCAKNKSGKYIAYFQSFTNTYASPDKLYGLFSSAIAPDYIVGLSVATRPDCLQQEKIEVLKEINKVKPVTVELGLQTVHEKTALYIRRGYKTEVYFDAVKRLKDAGIEVVTHIILGLPFETKDMMLETVEQTVLAGTDGIKFHLLHVIRGTDLEKDYNNGLFSTLSLNEYAEILGNCIKILPKNLVVHRITGDGAKKDLIAPLWSADKKRVLNYLNNYLAEV